MTYDHITRDISRKCDEDVAAAIHRNMQLVDSADAMCAVALMGASAALGAASGAFLARHKEAMAYLTEEQVAEALWAILQPMVMRGIVRLRAKVARRG